MSSYTRRQFLEDSALAAAVAAAFPAGKLLADDEQKKEEPKKVKKSGDLLGVAIVGAGIRGGQHVPAYLANPHAEIVYIVDPDEQRGHQFVEIVSKRQDRKPKFVRDLRAALDDKVVRLVSIATPNHWHALAAIWAMQAGKDVYVEKPVSHNVSEGRRIVETARKHKRICQAGTQCRSMKGTIDAIDYVKSGKIGEVKLARGLCYKRRKSIGPKGNYQVPPEVDYNLWCGPAPHVPLTRPQFHYDWHWQRHWGNGDMGNQGPHQMDIARWGLGADSPGRLGDRLRRPAGLRGRRRRGQHRDGHLRVRRQDAGLRGPRPGDRSAARGQDRRHLLRQRRLRRADQLHRPGGLRPRRQAGQEVHRRRRPLRQLHQRRAGPQSRRLLHADILEGHLSCAHSHLGNVSYYLGKPASVDEIGQGPRHAEDQRRRGGLSRPHGRSTWQANGVDLAKTPMSLGPMLKIDTATETVLDNAEACAC